MTTNISELPRSDTRREIRTLWSPDIERLTQILRAVASSFEIINPRNAPPTLETKAAFQYTSPKVAELERQLARLRSAITIAKTVSDSEEQIRDIELCMLFIRAILTGPIPVPVASWSPEAGATLFFDQEGRYGDLEIVPGGEVEYFLRWLDDGHESEVYDVEKIEGGNVPPKLLTYLYRMFARYNDGML